jgi:Rrf2 family nitric oxide-sensitive transcriptional repressor
MQLTKFTDYALRVLLYLGERPEELGSISQIAEVHDISRNHLMKIVRHLGHLGVIDTIRGRSGGIRLARPASEINLGKVIRDCEETLDLVDCGNCLLGPCCGLTHTLGQAMDAFFAVLDRTTLADILPKSSARVKL